MNIFAGNLSYRLTEEDLHDAFSEFGTVTQVRIVTDQETGKSKGFGFVTMPNDQEAQKAIDGLNGEEVMGRAMNVNPARERTRDRKSGDASKPRTTAW